MLTGIRTGSVNSRGSIAGRVWHRAFSRRLPFHAGRLKRTRCRAPIFGAPHAYLRKYSMTKFSDLGLIAPLNQALAAKGYENPTPI